MNAALQDPEVLARIGRNVLVFQQIEGMLRKIGLFVVAEGRRNDLATVRSLRATLKRAGTGTLLGRLAGKSSSVSPAFKAEIRRLVRARNDLVHRLIVLPGAGLLEGDARAAIAHLDRQYAEALRFREVVLPMYESIEDALARGEAATIVFQILDEA